MTNFQQVKELKEIFSKRYDRQFTDEEITKHCIAIIYMELLKKVGR